MNIKQIIKEYDSLFCHAAPDEIHTFLIEHISLAELESDYSALLTLLNEQVGYARETDCRDIALHACRQLKSLLITMNLYGTIPYGSTMLNIANTSRKFGLYMEAAEAFQAAERAYRMNLSENDYAFAGLYNNWSLLAMDQHQYGQAAVLIRQAITVIDRYEKAVIKQATARANLAIALRSLALETGDRGYCDEASSVLNRAIDLFEQAGGQEFHYSGAIATLADMQFSDEKYVEAAKNYDRAAGIIRMYMGNNATASDLMKKRELALSKIKEMD